ncbi:unnamed protein product [Cyprideis torosa]|uniref:Uncharacterized protein n=1 Tax=Cyprideis torosa TaxID=163714 RepID=A0A7R8WAK8_9CRUS|nr:unnamed protein product [Cyprideis torosa]CAG0889770.1 unnamed protein product [Cyprideis torosa]
MGSLRYSGTSATVPRGSKSPWMIRECSSSSSKPLLAEGGEERPRLDVAIEDPTEAFSLLLPPAPPGSSPRLLPPDPREETREADENYDEEEPMAPPEEASHHEEENYPDEEKSQDCNQALALEDSNQTLALRPANDQEDDSSSSAVPLSMAPPPTTAHRTPTVSTRDFMQELPDLRGRHPALQWMDNLTNSSSPLPEIQRKIPDEGEVEDTVQLVRPPVLGSWMTLRQLVRPPVSSTSPSSTHSRESTQQPPDLTPAVAVRDRGPRHDTTQAQQRRTTHSTHAPKKRRSLLLRQADRYARQIEDDVRSSGATTDSGGGSADWLAQYRILNASSLPYCFGGWSSQVQRSDCLNTAIVVSGNRVAQFLPTPCTSLGTPSNAMYISGNSFQRHVHLWELLPTPFFDVDLLLWLQSSTWSAPPVVVPRGDVVLLFGEVLKK